MGELENTIASEFEKLSGRVAMVAEECGHDLNDEAWVERMLHISEHSVDPTTGMEPKLPDLALAMALRFAADRRIDSNADALQVLCFGNWLVGMASILASGSDLKDKRHYRELLKSVKSEIGRHAVSQRLDQILKPDWLEHCRRVKESGKEVRTIYDLINGYPVEDIKRIGFPTLKRWAREVGFKFVSGRPTNK